jgi:NAD-dependent dihydropyrimidine dehydrogenase PreA subunit
MNTIKYLILNIVSIAIRLFPFPARTGLYKLGNPDRNSPVFLTCNFRLTVAQLKRVLEGMDAYLLVANSRGINVWCAATGGHFTNHDVVSVLKTSGIDELVDHRKLIMPQFAAAGVESRVVLEKTGWKVTWGPVYARDIPRYLQNDLKKTLDMLNVEFPLSQRIIMAAAWAFPMSLILGLILIPIWQRGIMPVVLVAWGFSLALFVTFPLYSHMFIFKGKKRLFGIFDFAVGGIHLSAWGLFMTGLIAYCIVTDNFSWLMILRWGIVSAIIVNILCYDLTGSVPDVKSSHHEDRLRTVVLDEEKCKGDAICSQVCPRNCFDINNERHVATMPGAERCVQCGACIIQCPGDALCFQEENGEIIPPETIRKFKLNLSGKRVVEP